MHPHHRLAAIVLAAALACAAPQAFAQAGSARAYDIPALPLGSSLARIAAESGQPVSVDAEVVRGFAAPAVRGSYTAEQAVRAAIAGSGLELVRGGSGGWSVRRGAAGGGTSPTLSEVRVTAQAEHSGTTEGTASYTTRSMDTATKLPLSIRDTPQSVTVVTSQRIEDQGLQSLADAVQVTPGLTVIKWGGERYRFTSRGFQVNNLMVDGLPIEYEEAALSTGALSLYDRVEVLRGAAGLTEGAGTPGGSINLVRKRPTKEFQGLSPPAPEAGAITWVRLMWGPINEAGTLRGRSVLSYQDKASFITDYQNRRTLLYGILEADLTAATTASLGASYSNEDNPGVDWNGLGTWPDGSFLPISRSTRMSPNWSYWDRRSTTVFADLEHRFGHGWKAKVAATAINSKMSMLGTYLRSSEIDSSGQPSFTLGGGGYDYDRTQRSIDAALTGTYAAWGRTHDLALGVSHRRSRWRDIGGGATVDGDFTIGTFNPLNWDANSIAIPAIGAYGLWQRKADMEQSSVYGTTRLAVTDATRLIVGGRLDWYERNQIQYDGDWPYGETRQKARRKFTPYAGIVHNLNETYAVYGSWTRIFNPQSYGTADGGTLPPETGTNAEFGIKGEYLGGRLNASAAIFQIELENLPDALPASSCATGLTACYQSAGKVRSRGVEFELNGEVAPGWQVAAGYTYASAKRVSEASGYDPIGTYSVGDRYATNIPRHLFKFATSYRLPGGLHRWKVGGSLHVQNEVYSPWGVHQGGYAVVGLQASYEVSKQLGISLNVNNLFDRYYYATIGSYSDANFFGEPRNVLLTARYRF